MAQEQEFKQIQMIPENAAIIVTGSVCKKEFKKDAYLYYLKNAEIAYGEHSIAIKRICLRLENDRFWVGDKICFGCKMRWMNQRRNTGGFDERQYYHSLGVATLLYCDDIPVILCEGKGIIRNSLFRLREQLRKIYVEELNEKDAGILSSMVLGDKSLMEEELKSLYSAAGISHILAVSGLHVSMIGMTIFNWLRKARRKYPMSCLVSGICLMLFCIMSGLTISALRAGIMFLIYLGAQLLGRKYNSFRAMALAATITLLWNPGAIYNAGFWLSYMAVVGAVGLGRLIRFNLKEKSRWKNIRNRLFQSAWFSSSIMLTTLPLTAYFFCEIPMYGVLANLVILPLAGIVMGGGLVGGFLCMTDFPFMWIFFLPCHLVLRLYELVCRGIELLPATSFITGQPKLWILFLYYGVLFASVLIYQKKDKLRKYWMFPGIAVAFMMVVFITPTLHNFQISYLDVGQGDGIFIRGPDGCNYMIDGGSTSEKQLGKYQLLPFLKCNGIRRIDVWIVSHADQDHISGMMELLDMGYPVKTLLVSEYMVGDENQEMLLKKAEDCGVEVLRVKNRDTIHTDDYQLSFLAPKGEDDRNQASLITLLKYKEWSFLFTGDIGAEQEQWLGQELAKQQITVLKAAHHGSKYSNSQDFLEKIRPELIVISAGANNLYGHPHEEAIDRMKEVGSRPYVTMDTGEIIVREKRESLWLQFLVNE